MAHRVFRRSRFAAPGRTRTERRGGVRRFLSTVALGFGLAVGVTIGAATPAMAGEAFLLSTKSIAPPAGFHGVCDRYAWACARHSNAARAMTDAERLALAREVNGRVNRTVRPVSDQRQYRAAEVWALPTARGGDCEDYALLKKRELIRLGVSPHRLLIATALTRKREAHAVLILRTGAGDMVLDNLTDRIRPWQKTTHSYLRMQDPDAPGRWQVLLAGGMFGKRGPAPGV